MEMNVLPVKDKIFFNEREVCNCECHQRGMQVMHCMPCCNFTSIIYLDDNYKLDEKKYKSLLESNK